MSFQSRYMKKSNKIYINYGVFRNFVLTMSFAKFSHITYGKGYADE